MDSELDNAAAQLLHQICEVTSLTSVVHVRDPARTSLADNLRRQDFWFDESL